MTCSLTAILFLVQTFANVNLQVHLFVERQELMFKLGSSVLRTMLQRQQLLHCSPRADDIKHKCWIVDAFFIKEYMAKPFKLRDQSDCMRLQCRVLVFSSLQERSQAHPGGLRPDPGDLKCCILLLPKGL
jgi:hypothetical protein